MAPIQKRPGWRGDPTWLADALQAFGVKVEERPGWKTWGNGDFADIRGVMAHHTGGNNTTTELISFGHGNLRGLLSQIHLRRDCVAVMCGVGVAWHAGVGSWPGLPTDNANWHTIGVEANSDGTTPWPADMLDAYYRICASICWVLDKPAQWAVPGHKEYGAVQGKWDPGGIDMGHFRAQVQAYIDRPPWTRGPSEEEQEMQFWNEVIPSLVDKTKRFARRDFLQLIDFHATHANEQSARALAELEIQREDITSINRKIDRLIAATEGK